MQTPTYAWECLACAADNPAGTTACTHCGCPALATAGEIARFRPGHAEAAAAHQRHLAAGKAAASAALGASRYRVLYWASVALFVFSLLVPNYNGFYMLVFGWLALKYTLAWIANPLLIVAFVVARPASDPGAWRWLAYSALALMLTLPPWKLKGSELLPFLPWLASAILLVIGIERYRRAYRKALAQALQCAGTD